MQRIKAKPMTSHGKPSSTIPAVHIENLGFAWPDEHPPLLSGLTLRVEVGQFTAITGPSGSGKSTLLYLLSGLLQPTSGSVTVLGTEVSGLTSEQAGRFRRRQIGFIFQSFHLLPHLTVAENVAVPLALTRQRWQPRQAIELLERLDLAHRRDAYPGTLSGGEAQRAAMARALIHRPPLLLADEPTGNLDPEHAQAALTLLTDTVREFGTTTLMVTHSVRAAGLADTVFELGQPSSISQSDHEPSPLD